LLKKILVVRFSSFGDIIQAMGLTSSLKNKYPNVQLDWLTKSQYENLVSLDSNISNVYSLGTSKCNHTIIKLAKIVSENNYDLVYDAHFNLRSIVLLFLSKFIYRSKAKCIFRSKNRIKRILLFFFKINLFPRPFIGRFSYISPLKNYGLMNRWVDSSWSFSEKIRNNIIIPSKPYVIFAPSAAWEMKRWPISHWNELIKQYNEKNILLIGGPEDRFIEKFVSIAPDRVKNFAGKINFEESAYLIKNADFVISADTGVIHVADLLGVAGILLLGPTAFGRTAGKHIKILEKDLSCRPCSKDGRGNCHQDIYQKCMLEISVQEVLHSLRS